MSAVAAGEMGSAFFDSRFTPGTLLAGRYRIVGRLGRGGMGEVYRADDLKLGQAVALKFLPETFARDPKWLRRFNDEVRIARDVAHPNVCRTYDIVEADGEHFISMEFVDGEDLSSLLRRIGRLPQDKAIEIARQLCAGLAAAHDRGVLHRDLKPANVMLDGRGRVRITDFGIAALAEEMHQKDARSGTPAYMAPEQLAGEAASVRSDIYSLGLVLYEVFTGKEAYHADSVAELQRMQQSGTFTTPSTLVRDLDPLVERVIMRCLERSPHDRPSSAIAVAAALPGGDPLAMALAAGETPSPEMVAQAGQSGGLRPAVALTLLIALVFLLVVSIVAKQRHSLLSLSPVEKTPEVIVDRANQLLNSFGYTDKPFDHDLSMVENDGYLSYIDETDKSSGRWSRLSSGQPSALFFQYRTSDSALAAWQEPGRVRWSDPPIDAAGMTRMRLDPAGRLRSFIAVPPVVEKDDEGAAATTSSPAAVFDWSAALAGAGLDLTTLHSIAPQRTPPVYCDQRAAWTGTWPGTSDELRVEAGAFAGRLVYFDVLGPWDDPSAGGNGEDAWLVASMLLGVPVIAMLLAYRNLRANRGDRRGATRLAMYVAGISFLDHLFNAHHPPAIDALFALAQAFTRSAGYGVMCWILYIAIEPYARRFWPHAIISWSRLLSGRFRDPMVGRDVLIGCLGGAVQFLVSEVLPHAMQWFGHPPYRPASGNLDVLLGARHVVGLIFSAQSALGFFIGLFVLLLIFRIVLRKPWLAMIGLLIFLSAALTGGFSSDWEEMIGGLGLTLTLVVLLVRFGLLTLLVSTAVTTVLWGASTTFDFSHWWAGPGIWGPLMVLALAGFGFWVSLAGQPLFKDELAAAR